MSRMESAMLIGRRIWLVAMLFLILFTILERSAIAANICPPVGASSDCGTIITIENSGATITHNPNIPPYDREPAFQWQGDDTLVGVRNNSTTPIRSIRLRSAHNIFGEDFGASPSDGICGTSLFSGLPFNPRPTNCPSGPQTLDGQAYTLTGYEGPGVFFTNTTSTEGTVRFEPPMSPGETRYFGLEAAISSAVSCRDVINNSIQTRISDTVNNNGTIASRNTQMTATFTPGINPVTGQRSTTSEAAMLCGVKKFNWISKMTVPDPSPYYEKLSFPPNTGRHNPYADNSLGNPSNPTSPRLTNRTGSFIDRPKFGYTNSTNTLLREDWYSFPFYWDMRSANRFPNGAVPPHSLLDPANYSESRLSFRDTPSDPCLSTPNAQGIPTGNPQADGCDRTLATGKLAFYTSLAGVLTEEPPTGVDLGLSFTWTSAFNGYALCQTTAGTEICATSGYIGDIVPNSGIGEVTVTDVQNTSTYNYNGIAVTAVNDIPTGGEKVPPAIVISANPMKLWPPNHKMVSVTVSGTITDIGPDRTGVNPNTATYTVKDEYGLVQPTGTITLDSNGRYSFAIQLQASRKGNDENGREYLITVSAEDNVGNKGSSSVQVVVPHDQKYDRKQ